MVMSATTLATELKNMTLFDTEAAARTAWAQAFDVYFKEAIAGVAGQVLVAGLTNCVSAMASALTGMSNSGQAATQIQAGIIAYWGAIVPALAWPACTAVTPPPTLTGIASALAVVFASNLSGAVSKDTAYDNIAASIHSLNGTGGVAVFPVPPTGIGPQPIT